MSEHRNDDDIRDPPLVLSAKDLSVKKSHSHKKKNPLPVQKSRPPKNSVKIKSKYPVVHFTWALILSILCFFIIGPCWALYKTYELRRMIKDEELEAAQHLSTKITTVLLVSTVIGAVVWLGLLFASAGIMLTGFLLEKNFI